MLINFYLGAYTFVIDFIDCVECQGTGKAYYSYGCSPELCRSCTVVGNELETLRCENVKLKAELTRMMPVVKAAVKFRNAEWNSPAEYKFQQMLWEAVDLYE